MDPLSEDRSPRDTVNYALAKERGQASHQKMNNTHTPKSRDNPFFNQLPYIKRQNKAPILPTPKTGQIQDSRRCGHNFLPGHFYPAKNEVCRICNKIGHFAKLCKSEMPSLPQYIMQQSRQPNYTGTQQQQRYNQLQKKTT